MFKLEAIKCKNCGSGLMVDINDAITYCSNCGSGFELVDGEMQPIEINFAAAAMRPDGEMIYKPFWFVRANVDITKREASGGFLGKMFGNKPQMQFSMNFYIPAFDCDIETLKNLAQIYTSQNPVASPQKYNTKLTGFAYGKEDAKKLCEFILISFEAEKKDTIKEFEFTIKYNSFEILGIPFYRNSDGRLTDGIFGNTYNIR